MPLTAIRKFLNVITFFLSITGIITNGVVIASLRLDTDYLRRECGQHVKSILYFAVFSGLSSLPYIVIIFINGANRCPLVSLMWTSALRVFTMRFEATQFLGLAVDRACSTMMPVTYNRYLRKHTCKMSLAAAFTLSCCDALLHLIKVEWFYEWHNICSILSASGPLARKYYMFTVDYATLTVTAACTLFYIYDTRQFNLMDNNTNGGLVIKISIALLCSFMTTYGIVNVITLARRLFFIDVDRIFGNYSDTLLQLNHVLLFIVIWYVVKHAKPKQLHSSNENSTGSGAQLVTASPNVVAGNACNGSSASARNRVKNAVGDVGRNGERQMTPVNTTRRRPATESTAL